MRTGRDVRVLWGYKEMGWEVQRVCACAERVNRVKVTQQAEEGVPYELRLNFSSIYNSFMSFLHFNDFLYLILFARFLKAITSQIKT